MPDLEPFGLAPSGLVPSGLGAWRARSSSGAVRAGAYSFSTVTGLPASIWSITSRRSGVSPMLVP